MHLGVTAWSCHIRHPDKKLTVPIGALEVNSDAAGGSLNNIKGGVGVLLPNGSWSYFPWPRWLHAGFPGSDGRALNTQLQYLELCGPLLALSCAPQLLVNAYVNFRIDNMSGVYTWRKGYSRRDPLATTLVKAIYDLALHLNVKPYITKVARCSTREAMAADCLSKGEFKEFFSIFPPAPVTPLAMPGTLARWMNWPVVDYSLGTKIAKEIKDQGFKILS